MHFTISGPRKITLLHHRAKFSLENRGFEERGAVKSWEAYRKKAALACVWEVWAVDNEGDFYFF